MVPPPNTVSGVLLSGYIRTSEVVSLTSSISACKANHKQTCERVSVGRRSHDCYVLELTDEGACAHVC